MTRRSVILVSALAMAGAPLGGALAQIAPAGSQIYREAPSGPRGLPPAWLVDDDTQPPPPASAVQSSPVQAAPLGPAANAAPSAAQDALRPPGSIGGPAPAATAAIPQQPGAQAPGAPPQPGAPVVTASLPPDDQPEVGEPKELPANLKRQLVDYPTKEPAGTIVIDTPNTYLYLVLGGGKAIRYGIGVGREGFTWSGAERVSRMKEWPDWFPPAEMIERQPYLPRMMAGGPGNPLGARALYLGHTLYRVHGTNQPSTIGKNVSSGCIRLLNEDIEDLYSRVQVGTRVVVLPGQAHQQPSHTAAVSTPAAGTALPPAPSSGPSPTINGLTGKPIVTR
jgi:lipoprotein-anchoring transpeptidase ErfK/SrfK